MSLNFEFNATHKPEEQAPARRKPYRSARRHFRSSRRVAVVRAFTAAELYLAGKVPTLVAAAESCGSNIHYVQGAIILIKDENPARGTSAEASTLIRRHMVLHGYVPLLVAANQARQQRKAKTNASFDSLTVDEVVAAWRAWLPEQRAEFGKGAGIAELWDGSIAPVIDCERAAARS
jgi:hypothetical protein